VRNSPANPRVRLEGGKEEELRVSEQRFPCRPWSSPAGAREQHEEGATERSCHG